MELSRIINILELLQNADATAKRLMTKNTLVEVVRLTETIGALEKVRGVESEWPEINTTHKNLVRALDKKPVDQQHIQQYFQQYIGLYTNSVISMLIKKLQEIKHLEVDEVVGLLQPFESGIFSKGHTSVVYILVARLLAYELPDIAYSYTIKAFEQNPHLAAQFGEQYKGYVYKNVAEDYYETCPVCGSEEAEPFYNALLFMAPGFSDVLHLPNCGVVAINAIIILCIICRRKFIMQKQNLFCKERLMRSVKS